MTRAADGPMVSALIPPGFQCPDSMRPHAQSVLRGEYDLPPGYQVELPLRVLDIGANVGAFALWASRKWPGCEIDCYEPHPQNATMLRANVAALRARVHQVAVFPKSFLDPKQTQRLYEGRNNCGEASLYPGVETRADSWHDVDCEDPSLLPVADIIKVDTEGCEQEILQGVRLHNTLVVMLEWHRPRDRWEIGAMLCGAFDCVRDEVRRKDRGVQVWVRSE